VASEADHPLVQLRALAGVTQESLSAVSGVGRSTIAVIEANGTNPSRRTVRRLGSAFSLDEEAMASVLSGRAPVSSVAKHVSWRGTTEPRSGALVVTAADQTAAAVRAAQIAGEMIAAGFRRNNATLDELDIVRQWVNAMGPIREFVEQVSAAGAPERQKFVDLLFREARTMPGAHGGTALVSIVIQILSQLDWEPTPADPYKFSPRRRG
jgi:transcriptional regulator with XRE-family HTH domain